MATPTTPSLLDRARSLFGRPERSIQTLDLSTGPIRRRNVTRRPPPPAPPVRKTTTERKAGGVTNVASRASIGGEDYGSGLQGFAVFSSSSYWREFALADNISLADLSRVPIHRVAELLSQISPEVSMGLYIRTIFSNSGFEIRAMNPTGEETNEAAQAKLDGYRHIIKQHYGTEDVFFNRMFMSYFLRGSVLAELVLKNGREFADIATPDPHTLHFRRIKDDVRGSIWDFGQIQNGQFVSLAIPTIRYVPLNPFPDSIEGQPLISSSFFIAVFMMAVLRDFKRVIQQQGYPRYDIEIDLEQMRSLMPDEAETDNTIFQAWAEKIRDSIKEYVKDLEPDETFIHYTGIKVNTPVGAMGTNSLTTVDALFKVMERIAARSLKVPPILMGITDGVSEANANRQFEGFLKDIQNGQHAVETSIGDLYQLALQADGIQARVEVKFAELRSSERQRDALADQTETQTATLQYNQGWISQDEAARRGAKVRKADVPEPRQTATTTPTDPQNGPQPDAGVNRGVFERATLTQIQDAENLLAGLIAQGRDLMTAEPTEVEEVQ